jgi:hypothetical protein
VRFIGIFHGLAAIFKHISRHPATEAGASGTLIFGHAIVNNCGEQRGAGVEQRGAALRPPRPAAIMRDPADPGGPARDWG